MYVLEINWRIFTMLVFDTILLKYNIIIAYAKKHILVTIWVWTTVHIAIYAQKTGGYKRPVF